MYASTGLVAATLALQAFALPTTPTSGDKVARACAPLSTPTKPYTIVAIAPNTAVHQMTMNLGPNHQVILGGEPVVPPCPPAANGDCAPGAYSVWKGFGALDVQVSGGQRTYVGPAGALGFTATKTNVAPKGAKFDPFTYDKQDQCNSPHGVVSTKVFGASGLMACPRTDHSGWRVWANFPAAKVPTGNNADCIPFQAFTYDYDDASNGGYGAAAYQYGRG